MAATALGMTAEGRMDDKTNADDNGQNQQHDYLLAGRHRRMFFVPAVAHFICWAFMVQRVVPKA